MPASRLFSFLLLLTAGAGCFPSYGQYNDAGLWLGTTVEKKISPSNTLVAAGEIRMNENITQVGAAFIEGGLTHKFNKYLSFGINYRFIERRQLGYSYSTRHRIYADITGKYKLDKLSFSLRERIQLQVRDYYSSETGRIPEWYLRSKLSIKYNLRKKITPMVAVEIFYQLTNPSGNEIDGVRYYAGFDYEFNKRHAIEPYYLIQSEKNVKNPETDFVIGVGYTYSF